MLFLLGDPIFWLHHGMIDYVWWLWEQYYATNVIPSGWDGQVPRPYSQWTLYDSFNERNFCYTYQRYGNAKRRFSRKLSHGSDSNSTAVGLLCLIFSCISIMSTLLLIRNAISGLCINVTSQTLTVLLFKFYFVITKANKCK